MINNVEDMYYALNVKKYVAIVAIVLLKMDVVNFLIGNIMKQKIVELAIV